MFDLLKYNSQAKYLIWDVETCHLGLALEDNLPWQLGLVLAQGKQIKEVQNHYIKWDKLSISKGAALVTRFDRNIYEKEAKENQSILELLESYLYNPEYYVIFQNGLAFDCFIHTIWRKHFNKKHDYCYFNRCFDTKALSAAYKLGVKELPKKDRLIFQYKYLSYV
ncbi:MAG: hypothetical protein AABY22_20895, partial [Nanoarchaeota archaeon]